MSTYHHLVITHDSGLQALSPAAQRLRELQIFRKPFVKLTMQPADELGGVDRQIRLGVQALAQFMREFQRTRG